MNVAGIIAEYNPFHTGHAYHVAKTRRETGCDFLIAVMGGSFSQRGDVMLFDKWTRTEMALHQGVDLVLELPALFAVRSADWFARGGIHLLSGLNVVSTVSFGCETDSLPRLNAASKLLADEPAAFRSAVKQKLGEGKSHARARGEALSEWFQLPPQVFNAPNTALALEYLRANAALEAPMQLHPIRRTSGYHDDTLSEYASASAIRKALSKGIVDEALTAMPEFSAQMTEKKWPHHAADISRLDEVLLYAIRTATAESIRALPDVSEGLEMRVIKAAASAASREELLNKLKCKRYTMARLSRLLTHVMLSSQAAAARNYTIPPYARILGFRETARPLLRRIDQESSIPLASDPTRLKGNPCFDLEARATDLWGLATENPLLRCAGRDFTERMIVVK